MHRIHSTDASICALCERPVAKLTLHHLVPKSYSKKQGEVIGPTIAICSACHRQLHVLFPHRVLGTELASVEALRAHPEMARFLRWLRKQDPNRGIRVARRR